MFHIFWFFNSGWKFGGNCSIFWKCILLFNILLYIIMFLKNLSIFWSQISRRKRSVLKWTLLCWIICKYWNIFFVLRRYTTMNVTMMIGWFASMCIIWRIVGWLSTLDIFLMVIICFDWMKWPMLFSSIILDFTGSFLWKPIVFWIILRTPLWLMVYKHTVIYFQQHNC